jgi:hypothetical protein
MGAVSFLHRPGCRCGDPRHQKSKVDSEALTVDHDPFYQEAEDGLLSVEVGGEQAAWVLGTDQCIP